MAETIAGINPTRMELIKLRKKIRLAQKGHRLLKEKRDALVVKFLEIVKEGGRIRDDVETNFQDAYKELFRAQALMGTLDVASAAMAVRELADLKFRQHNIIGVNVPELVLEEDSRDISNRGYSPITASVTLDEAATRFEEALRLVVKMAETEKTIQMLAHEVQRTKRRVNALEYIVVPRLGNTATFIKMRLDEMEREDFSRLKKIKGKMEIKKKGKKKNLKKQKHGVMVNDGTS